jgi:hypothetical protein
MISWIGLTLWLALPVFLLIQPADFFDTGTAICPSKRFLHIECPGCGLTRAVQHAIHCDLKRAWEFNKLVIVILPILLLLYIHILGRLLGKNYFGFLRRYY